MYTSIYTSTRNVSHDDMPAVTLTPAGAVAIEGLATGVDLVGLGAGILDASL